MNQEKSQKDGFCYKILKNISNSINSFMETLQKEKEYLNLIQVYWMSENKNKKENGNNTVISTDDDEKCKMRKYLLEDISKLLSKYKEFLEHINYKITNLMTEENKNSSYFVREEIYTYAKVTLDSANLSDKLNEYHILINTKESEKFKNKLIDSEEICGLNKFNEMSDAISFNIKKKEAFTLKMGEMVKAGSFFKISSGNHVNGNAEEEQRNYESIGRKETVLNILKNENYFHGLKENNYEEFISCLKKFAKFHEINFKFLKDIRRVIDQEYDVDFTMSRRQWFKRIAVNNNVLTVYEFVKLTLVTTLNEIPIENLQEFLNSLFRQYFYKVENKRIRIFGRLHPNNPIKSFIKMNKFPETFKLLSCKMKVFYWFQDLMDIYNLNISDFLTNLDEQQINNLMDSTQELRILRDIYAVMIVDFYKRKNPQAIIEELQS